jgi:hypothetical protein
VVFDRLSKSDYPRRAPQCKSCDCKALVIVRELNAREAAGYNAGAAMQNAGAFLQPELPPPAMAAPTIDGVVRSLPVRSIRFANPRCHDRGFSFITSDATGQQNVGELLGPPRDGNSCSEGS